MSPRDTIVGFLLGYLTRWVQESGRAQAAYSAAMERARETMEDVSARFRKDNGDDGQGD